MKSICGHALSRNEREVLVKFVLQSYPKLYEYFSYFLDVV
jgi:hypothetical protein